MLDINFVRKNPEAVEQNAKNKGYDIDVKSILGLDEKPRDYASKLMNFDPVVII